MITKKYTVERKRISALHKLEHLLLEINSMQIRSRSIINLLVRCYCPIIAWKSLLPGELVSIKEQPDISVQAIMMHAQLKGIIDRNSAQRFWRAMQTNKKEEGLW